MYYSKFSLIIFGDVCYDFVLNLNTIVTWCLIKKKKNGKNMDFIIYTIYFIVYVY